MPHQTRSPSHVLIWRRYFLLLMAAALAGCREDTTGPSSPEAAQSLAAATAGPLTFRQLSAGSRHTCGVTIDNLAYCWGLNATGQLGDGTTTNRSRPAAVSGGLQFREISPGSGADTADHTCGLTTGGKVYCWGENGFGQLGDGTTDNSSTPVSIDDPA